MPATATTRRFWPSRQLVVRLLAAALCAAVLLAASMLIANSRLPRRAAGLYGGLFEKIRRHPVATAAICIGGIAFVWGGIGLVAATEGRIRSARRPKD
jgi:hypothetical protein